MHLSVRVTWCEKYKAGTMKYIIIKAILNLFPQNPELIFFVGNFVSIYSYSVL